MAYKPEPLKIQNSQQLQLQLQTKTLSQLQIDSEYMLVCKQLLLKNKNYLYITVLCSE